jgi:hypothetical protein
MKKGWHIKKPYITANLVKNKKAENSTEFSAFSNAKVYLIKSLIISL